MAHGSWCLFRFGPLEARSARVVLAEHQEIRDPDLGGHLTLRLVEEDLRTFPDGSWQVILKPASTDPAYEPIVIRDPEEGSLRLIAELVEVLL